MDGREGSGAASDGRSSRSSSAPATPPAALRAAVGHRGTVLVLFGDSPLVTTETMPRLVEARRKRQGRRRGARLRRAGSDRLWPPDRARRQPQRIVEHRDADATEHAIGFCNSGVMAIDGAVLWDLLDAIGNDNAKGEYYLTDIVAIARAAATTPSPSKAPKADRHQLPRRAGRGGGALPGSACAPARSRRRHLTDPDSVFLCADTKLGRT